MASNSIIYSLSGDGAFYNQPNYIIQTQSDLERKTPLPVSYVITTENKITKLVKTIFSTVFFPLLAYQWLHAKFAQKVVLPASNPNQERNKQLHTQRTSIDLKSDLKYKRLAIQVDDCIIDAMIIGKSSTLGEGRWILFSNGNFTAYEWTVGDQADRVNRPIEHFHSNALIFNYPGVSASTGWPHRPSMAKVYRALLTFLADQQQGIAAKEIIGFGHSLGGGVQAEGRNSFVRDKKIAYVFIKSRTFSDLSTAATRIIKDFLSKKTKWPDSRIDFICRVGRALIKILNWNIRSVNSSQNQQTPEIILQTANVKNYEILTDSSKLIDDGTIAAEASLAKALLDHPSRLHKDLVIIGIPDRHNDLLSDLPFIAQHVEMMLTAQK